MWPMYLWHIEQTALYVPVVCWRSFLSSMYLFPFISIYFYAGHQAKHSPLTETDLRAVRIDLGGEVQEFFRKCPL